MEQWRDCTALITGASRGLGADFARLLAARGCNLVLTARAGGELKKLADDLSKRYGVSVAPLSMDLSDAAAAELLEVALRQREINIDILINNAGFGLFGEFLETDLERIEDMLRVNMLALTSLIWRLGSRMAERGRGWILNVSSIGAYQPTPLYAAYSASKSYVLLLSEGLRRELKPKGVIVTALSPGVTKTRFLNVSGQSPSLYQRLVMMESDPVARAGLRALARGRASVVPGLVNKLTVFTMRLLPRRWQAAIAEWSMRH